MLVKVLAFLYVVVTSAMIFYKSPIASMISAIALIYIFIKEIRYSDARDAWVSRNSKRANRVRNQMRKECAIDLTFGNWENELMAEPDDQFDPEMRHLSSLFLMSSYLLVRIIGLISLFCINFKLGEFATFLVVAWYAFAFVNWVISWIDEKLSH